MANPADIIATSTAGLYLVARLVHVRRHGCRPDPIDRELLAQRERRCRVVLNTQPALRRDEPSDVL
ncbi:hypothetical protein F0L68_00160 [Solihabitans fulvus]|uniref:Uncharacterized protein n=1 Tax=Solihabitans fulvus TaxID=1892852 RepID=A0A5B2XSU8_9PSEU|nr:hypothetical protein [Solihabitans fulvus]KAA2266988.1 hypothetical protein F0L68_00160 [Solihabitans fulvus]